MSARAAKSKKPVGAALLIVLAIVVLSLAVEAALIYLVPSDIKLGNLSIKGGGSVASVSGGVALFFVLLNRITTTFKAILIALAPAFLVFIGVSAVFLSSSPDRPPAVTSAAPEYSVVFDANTAELTPDASQVIEEAAKEAGRASPIRIILTEHSDAAEASADPEPLSRSRATKVAEALILRGIASDKIVVVEGDKTILSPSLGDGKSQDPQIVIEIR